MAQGQGHNGIMPACLNACMSACNGLKLGVFKHPHPGIACHVGIRNKTALLKPRRTCAASSPEIELRKTDDTHKKCRALACNCFTRVITGNGCGIKRDALSFGFGICRTTSGRSSCRRRRITACRSWAGGLWFVPVVFVLVFPGFCFLL